MRRHGTSFRLPSFACRVSSHQRLFRHVRGRIALYGRDESARLVPHPPRPSFKRSHTTPRACAYVPARGAEGRGTARCHYDRRTDGRTGVRWCVKSHGTGRGRREDGDGKLMEPRPSGFLKEIASTARARARGGHQRAPGKSTRSPDVATMAAGGILGSSPSGLGLGEDG